MAARAATSATFLFASEARYPIFYAESVECQYPMCYTRANNGTASDLTLASVAGLTAAKEES
jgi:hypothetical protein